MLRIAVCDDSRTEGARIRELLEKYQQTRDGHTLDVRLFSSAADLLAAARADGGFQVYLLDIIMPGMDGIALAQALREGGSTGVIVFLTATRDFAVEAFGVRAANYLLKPVDGDALFAALDDAVALLSSRHEAYTLVQVPQGDRMVALSDIVAVEVQGHTLCYYLTGERQLKSKVLRVSFATAAQELIDDGRFIRPHQSYLVNAGHVACFSKQRLSMDNGMVIPISRLRFAQVKSEYMNYLTRLNTAARGGEHAND